ncbi:hypothetical protein [Methanobacterium sp.]|uniref:hypothetical protein n=1 Tax=Methanobacterium sp. TaxID=2164 RepID=UPI003C76DC7A
MVLVGLDEKWDNDEKFVYAVEAYLTAINEIVTLNLTIQPSTMDNLKLELANLILLNKLSDIEEKNKEYLINKITELIELYNLISEYKKERIGK